MFNIKSPTSNLLKFIFTNEPKVTSTDVADVALLSSQKLYRRGAYQTSS